MDENSAEYAEAHGAWQDEDGNWHDPDCDGWYDDGGPVDCDGCW